MKRQEEEKEEFIKEVTETINDFMTTWQKFIDGHITNIDKVVDNTVVVYITKKVALVKVVELTGYLSSL